MMVDRLAANPLVLQLPWGTEGDFHGVHRPRAHERPLLGGRHGRGVEGHRHPRGVPRAGRGRPPRAVREARRARRGPHGEVRARGGADRRGAAQGDPRDDARRARACRCSAARAFKNKGVQLVLDAIVGLPAEPARRAAGRGPPAPSRRTTTSCARPTTRSRSPRSRSRSCPTRTSAASPTCASTRGVLHSGSHVMNSTKDRKERIGRILQMHANHREDKEAAYTGDIVAVVGLKHSTTGDTICDPDDPVVLESITFPTPVISRGRRAEDEGRPGQARHRPRRSSPTRTRRSS